MRDDAQQFSGRGRGEGHHHHSWHHDFDELSYRDDERRQSGRRDRLEKGMLRFLLLAALQHGPKHGYEIIKWLEERTSGRYTPSPGTVYPTLQLLNDQGFIQADQSDDRCVYHLTTSGEIELNAHTNVVNRFWERFSNPFPEGRDMPEIGFLHEEMGDLKRTIWNGLRTAIQGENQKMVLEMRLALERCQNEIREIITNNTSTPTGRNTPLSEEIHKP